jgi:hypothetical protein
MIFYENPSKVFIYQDSSTELHHYPLNVDFVYVTPWLNIIHLWKL